MMWTSFVFFLLLPVDDGGKRSGSPLTLDDLFNRNFQVHDPGAKWINGIHTHTHKKTDLITAEMEDVLFWYHEAKISE